VQRLPPQLGRHRHRGQQAEQDRGVEAAALAHTAYLAAPDVPFDPPAQRAGGAAFVVEDGGQFPAVLPLGSGQQQNAQ
jgi:hypothetical protein